MRYVFIFFNIVLVLGSIGWILSDTMNFEPYLFLLATLLALIPNFKYYKKIEILQKNSCKKLAIQDVKRNFASLKAISLVGKNEVGKTTLIENICWCKNQKMTTQGSGAYIVNFSKNRNKFAALLDASGQSQSLQNDIALDAEYLIVILDHNSNNYELGVSKQRLKEEENFITLLIERLKTKNHKIKWVHVLLNKKDIWQKFNTPDKMRFETWGKEQVETLKTALYPIEVTYKFHSNSNSSDCTEVINLILSRL